MAKFGFLPRRVKGLDDRQHAIFDAAASYVKSREHIMYNLGVEAQWQVRKKGLRITLRGLLGHAHTIHSWTLFISWKGHAVFTADIIRELFAVGRHPCKGSVLDDAPGAWENVLADLRRK